ncbi:MAG: hypothetical protein JWP63_4176 [Candidatus Solibacter sp.]|jgi:hypothetical protein|nr:hypothetical protein [Candidatus Solibacter sp.]
MDQAALQTESAERFDNCTRCLQPVPVRAARCPGCGQPHQNRRWIPLAIGTAGVFALVFVMLLMYYAAWKADLATAEVAPDDNGAQADIMVKTPEEGGKPSPPPAPEKKPPLNDR